MVNITYSKAVCIDCRMGFVMPSEMCQQDSNKKSDGGTVARVILGAHLLDKSN